MARDIIIYPQWDEDENGDVWYPGPGTGGDDGEE